MSKWCNCAHHQLTMFCKQKFSYIALLSPLHAHVRKHRAWQFCVYCEHEIEYSKNISIIKAECVIMFVLLHSEL